MKYVDNSNCALSFLRSLCEVGGDCFEPRYFSEGAMLPKKNTEEKYRWLFWTEVFFWGSYAPEEKYRGPKQSPTNSHNDQNKDGTKLLLSLKTAI